MATHTCPHSTVCTACPIIGLDHNNQREFKIQHWQDLLLKNQIKPASTEKYIFLENPHLRDKLDFVIEADRKGLWSEKTQNILDLPTCSLLSSDLAQLYQDFRSLRFPFQNKASFRLRVSPQQQKGLWIDASHLDTRALLEDTALCHSLLELGYVEIGQRFKKLTEIDQQTYKLKNPELHPWFESIHQNQMVPLNSFVGSFTQPSLQLHRLMIAEIKTWLDKIKPNRAFEYGCGIGNWTFALLNSNCEVYVTESDRNSLVALESNLSQYQLNQRVKVLDSNFQQRQQQIDFQPELLFLNPSRSGVGSVINSIPKQTKWIIYISCYPESLVKDMQVLNSQFELQESILVDQFPSSKHYEVLSLWRRI